MPTEKRKISILIPFRQEKNNLVVFLQKRSKTAKVLPDYFGFWGGGAENDESPEETLKREIKEELNYDPIPFQHFGQYEFLGSIKNIFTHKVSFDFESRIVIGEGDYGKFFTEEEIMNESMLILEDKLVLQNFFRVQKEGNPWK